MIYLGTNAISMGGFSKVMLGTNQIWAAAAGQTKAQLVQSLGGILYYDALKANGSGLPSNSPLTSPWVDLINSYDGTLTGFAGTTSSGWDISDTSNPFLKCDGTNDWVDTGLAAVNFPISSGVGSFWVYVKVKIGALGTDRGICSIDRDAAGGASMFNVWRPTSDNKITFGVYSNSMFGHKSIKSINAVAQNDVLSIFAVLDMSSATRVMQLYINGTAQVASGNTFTGAVGTPTGNMVLGSRFNADVKADYWNGGIYGFALGNGVLTQSDVNNLIAAGL